MRRWHPWMVAGALVLATGCPAQAVDHTSWLPGEVVAWRASTDGRAAELRVRELAVARLDGPGAWARVSAAVRTLRRPLPPPAAVRVRARRGSAALLVDGQVVLIASARDAQRAGTDPATLAALWAARLREALAIPPLTVTPTSVVLSPDGTATLRVQTVVPGPLSATPANRRVVSVEATREAVTLRGHALGATTVRVRLGPYQTSVPVSVRPPAGRIPPEAEVVVTGTPAPAAIVHEAVRRWLEAAVVRTAGAVVRWSTIPVDTPLEVGAAVTVHVPVSVRSPYAGPVDRRVAITVRNAPLPLRDPDVLLVSNRPETIDGNGLLFEETLQPRRGARLLYHHMNGTERARILSITLSNAGPGWARVHYLSGHAGPAPDPLQVGAMATGRFLTALGSGQGYLVEVPAQQATTFTAYTLPPRALVSGIMQFQVVDGGPVGLRVAVRLPWLLDRTVTTDLGPYAFPHPRGTFPGTVVDVAREVRADRPADVAELGIMADLKDVRTGEALVGDYGVLYRIRLRLHNPTAAEVPVALVANAAGGPARGLFVIDGTMTDAGLLAPGVDRAVATFVVPAGETRDLTVVTMPVAGSFYPVRLSVRPR
ncbi:MAG: hypothetical protein QN157_00300 [Armatimonadota bacterium]|nr:hypothetical protein [Armatimonadota bacterium]